MSDSLNNIKKKQLEFKPVNLVMTKMPEFIEYNKISDDNQERPDFLYQKDEMIIGVELIGIPLLTVDKQNAHYLIKDKIRKLYKANQQEADYNKQCIETEKHINETLNIYKNFEYTQLMNYCKQVLGVVCNQKNKRRHNASEYLQSIQSQFPTNSVKIIFIIDIGYDIQDLRKLQYRQSKDHSYITCSRNDYPFTHQFLSILGQVKDVYDFYIVWHPFDDYQSKRVKLYNIHFDNNKNILPTSNYSYVWYDYDAPYYKKHSYIKLNVVDDIDCPGRE